MVALYPLILQTHVINLGELSRLRSVCNSFIKKNQNKSPKKIFEELILSHDNAQVSPHNNEI